MTQDLINSIGESLRYTNLTSATQNVDTGEYMPLFDTRVYRSLCLYNSEGNDGGVANNIYPHYSYGSYVTDYYETPSAVQQEMEEFKSNNSEFTDTDTYKKTVTSKEERIKFINEFNDTNENSMLAPHSFIHPYALIKLAGAHGNTSKIEATYDVTNRRKWYEIEGSNNMGNGYAKNPTTTTLIKWGNEDARGRTPYSFQDFVFCKHWNKIQNNRMITLRRYATPVTDAITFSDYDAAVSKDPSLNATKAKEPDKPWAPISTAITYFGEGTDNSISELLSFSAKYNWEPMTAEANPIDISSQQNEQGSNMISGSSTLSSGMAAISQMLGFWDTFKAEQNGTGGGIDPALTANNVPPDPYTNGPYENRILGPINVIMDTYKRKRGLKFDHTIKLNFDYVARPIAGINNKAILLDILSNILVMCYASGTWFGGMWRYKTERPAVYPFKYGDAMNKLYRGEILGKQGVIATVYKHAYADGKGLFSSVFKDAVKALTNAYNGMVDALLGTINGDSGQKEKGKEELSSATSSATVKTIEKVIAARALSQTTIPYIHDQRALLTGDPVGDWHLTIGNPLNPIAMIGNLIVTNLEIKFSDELGPDDFPVGFRATIELAHGLGRDRDAIESMFNRGFGRIYTVSSGMRSSADHETKVDKNTGDTSGNRKKYEETRNTFFGRGFRFIAKTEESKLRNSGVIYEGGLRNYPSLANLNKAQTERILSKYMIDPWQINWCM